MRSTGSPEGERTRNWTLTGVTATAAPSLGLQVSQSRRQRRQVGQLVRLHGELARRGIALRIVGARGRVRDLLRADGIGEKVGGLDRLVTLQDLLGSVPG